ncbi:unnamed protein product [Adineta steineri]|uniref:EGF-like domain-containing protein n=1 Tax=Adineta steineri TaxID=433720 RepID=A0A819MNH2_9BILA|nr:unnamed protein product [Adineta steineri]
MLFLSFIIIQYVLLFNLFNMGETIVCPSSYNSILNGCYKMNNGTNLTWSDARQYCINDTSANLTNRTGYTTHLVAFESVVETTSLVYWMKAWGIESQFWTDGVAASSSWNWSNQAVSWYFNASDQLINGNASNYRIVYSNTVKTYQVVDDMNSKLSHFICEYQDRCSTNNSCLNNATCYLNVGRELCICAPGYTGTYCDQQIDECLSSPCQHGGSCYDALNNYTCDCSNVFFSGPNCDIPKEDPTQGQRHAAFWSVLGFVCGLVVLLTLSDLPWDDIASTIGCPWYRFKCCSYDDDDDNDDDNRVKNANSPMNEQDAEANRSSMPNKTVKGVNYHVMNTVWDPEHVRTETPSNPQYNGYHSPDQHTTPNNALIQSFAAVVLAKQKEKELDDKRVYAVDIVQQNDTALKAKRPLDTMTSWTHQLQEQLKSKQARPTSSGSTNELIQSENKNNS